MNSNRVSILESIKQQQQQQHFNCIIGGRVVDVGDDGPDNDSPLENPETAIQKLKNWKFDLQKNINCEQRTKNGWTTTPMIVFCCQGDLLMCRFLKQHGASCTKRDSDGWFPMIAAAMYGRLETCQWLYNDCGDGAAKDINNECDRYTPLSESICNGHVIQSQWFVLHGGAQQLSEEAVQELRTKCKGRCGVRPGIIHSVKVPIVFHDVSFLLFLSSCASNTSTSTSTHNSTTMADINTTASASMIDSPPNNLPLLNGQPGVMELIGPYAGLIYGKEIRRLKEFIVLVK